SFGSSWGDIDNDGDLDLFVANGWAKTGLNNQLFRNLLAETGTATFEEISGDPVVQDGGWSYGSSFADYDSDGDLDLFVAKWLNSKDENNALFRNDLANENNWLIVNCVGTTSNRSAIGATVRVKAKINGKSVWQMRQISGQDSYCGQNLQLHFGLGNAQSVDSLIVNWPSGVTQTVAISAINRSTTISEHR
ncbi:MAG: CRTAC1 family protein, partial [Calditrichaeota bacterium]|nr:CRTAC1 family protein [Calditrichota bacterium]